MFELGPGGMRTWSWAELGQRLREQMWGKDLLLPGEGSHVNTWGRRGGGGGGSRYNKAPQIGWLRTTRIYFLGCGEA